VTPAVADILDTLLDRPAGARWQARELAEETGRPVGEVYDVLAWLEVRGLVRWHGSPYALRGYALTAQGIEHALAAMAEAM
jgi:DNA-binding IclR family transcriptional regulator